MITQDQMQDLAKTTAYDRSGDKIGSVGTVYADDKTGDPTWVTVSTGLFGTHESFVPMQGADFDGDRFVLNYEKQLVKDAPRIEEDGHLSVEEEQQLYRYYGLEYGTDDGADSAVGGQTRDSVSGDRGRTDVTDATTATTGDYVQAGGRHESEGRTDLDERGGRADVADREGRADTVGHDTSGPNTDDAMTRSEERLRVGTEQVESGRARLRKYVVTENVSQTVPTSHDEVRVEREPITDANRGAAHDGPAISEEEHEVVLHAERPVVSKETEAVERVRLNTETVRGEEQVNEQLRKEQIDTDGVERTTGEQGASGGGTRSDR